MISKIQSPTVAADPLYDINKAAEYLGGVSYWTVRSWISKGRVKPTKVGARTMIRQSELERFIQDENK